MLWLKWLLGYCMLVGLGLWFGYRSRNVLPGHDCAPGADLDWRPTPETPSPRGDPRSF